MKAKFGSIILENKCRHNYHFINDFPSDREATQEELLESMVHEKDLLHNSWNCSETNSYIRPLRIVWNSDKSEFGGHGPKLNTN